MKRRTFLKSSPALSVGSLAAATVLSRSLSFGKAPPSARLRAGFVGVGGRAGTLLREFSGQSDLEVVAVADIDSRRVPRAMKELATRGIRQPKIFTDFRKILEDATVDILVVGTPDHWHAIPTIMGCLAGKDVYVEKPDGHNMLEGQRMVEAMRKHKRIVQLGTQSRSLPQKLEAMEYVRSGKLGRVLVAKAWETTKQRPIGYPADSDPPRGVDYDFWLGPAPKRRFNPARFHGSWRWFFDYGTGDLGNDGVHRIDYARWALETAVEAEGGAPLGLPTKISALGGKWHFDDAQQWPDTLQVSYQYPSRGKSPGRILTYEMRIWSPYKMHGEGEAAVIYGDQGYLVITNNDWRAHDSNDKVIARNKVKDPPAPHVRNFLDCVKSRQRPNADLETIGHPSSIFCHAANVAWKLGRQLELDPDTELFVNDPEANALRTRSEYRKPWTLPEV